MYSFADIPNLHTHTSLCKHAKGNPADYCEVAQKHSDIIGFSDHCPFPDDRNNAERMLFAELTEYSDLVEDAKKRYPGMTVFRGIEAEFYEDIGKDFYSDTLLNKYSMDYLVGSAHYCSDKKGNQFHFSNYKADLKVAKYFCDLTLKIIESGLFLFVAHPDAFMVPYDNATKEHESMFKDIISCATQYNVPIELNGMGIRYKRNYPCRRFWEIAAEYSNLQTVISSDAHKPDHLFDSAVETALDWANELQLNICNCKIAEKIKRGIKK